MKVELLSHTPLSVSDIAISKCYGKEPYDDIEKQQSRINKVANVSKHSSTIEHIVFSFDIDGISRAVLQELVRHRISSYTVKSSRYTLQELKNEKVFDNASYFDVQRAKKYIVFTGSNNVDLISVKNLENLRHLIASNYDNDLAKYCMPEAYKTALVMTINARALQNFLSLRTDKHALWEIQNLSRAMYDVIPETHKFLFKESVKEQK